MRAIERAGRAAFERWHQVMDMPYPPWNTLGDGAKRAWEEAAKESAISIAESRKAAPGKWDWTAV